ncbi:MAG: hypothetical protein QOD77_1291 [Thermoplasmata archaeon]|nr:hypothetical protein [Thermoplasmata archaeon]
MLLAGCAGISDSGSIGIDEDQYYQIAFEAKRAGTLTYSFSSTQAHNIDALVMDAANFQQFSSQHSFTYLGCSEAPARAGGGTCPLDAGEWHIVFDNTNAGQATPPFNAVNDPAFVTWSYSFE